jgi:hypothetical protein
MHDPSEDTQMSFKAKVVKVMIASPGDVARERQLVRDVIYEWNNVHSEDKDLVLLPVGWESHASPEMGDRPQAIINKQVLADSDLLIAVFWTRLGSPTGKSSSGTVEEIEEHLKAGKPAMIYFSSAPVLLESVDEGQYRALRKFKDECREKGLYAEYDSPPDFKEKLARQLAQTVIRRFAKKNGRPSENDLVVPKQRAIPQLSDHAIAILHEAVMDDQGTILRDRDRGGLHIQTHGIELVNSHDSRTEAQWEAGFRQLCEKRLIEDLGRGVVFSVTNEGYRVADLLPAETSVS